MNRSSGLHLIGLSGLLLILGGLPCLLLAPGEIGSIRGAGVSLAWWYGGVVGELLGLAAAFISLGFRKRASSIAEPDRSS